MKFENFTLRISIIAILWLIMLVVALPMLFNSNSDICAALVFILPVALIIVSYKVLKPIYKHIKSK